MSEPVSRELLEAELIALRAQTPNPAAGLFGPGSVTWKINRHVALMLGGGRALLLQTAHPWVSYAVAEHSKFRTDPHGRGERTFKAVNAMVFGDLDMAFRAARGVHAVHSRVTGELPARVGAFDAGTPYDANQVEGLLWVFATLWETAALVYELVVGPLSLEEKERYYDEGKRFAACFGITESDMPPNWHEFIQYNERMWNSLELEVDAVGLEIADYILQPPKPSLAPAMEWYKIITAGLMPERIRHEYRFCYGRLERRIFEASMAAIRTGHRLTPGYLKYAPVYFHGLRRAAGRGLYDPLALRIESAMFGKRRGADGRAT